MSTLRPREKKFYITSGVRFADHFIVSAGNKLRSSIPEYLAGLGGKRGTVVIPSIKFVLLAPVAVEAVGAAELQKTKRVPVNKNTALTPRRLMRQYIMQWASREIHHKRLRCDSELHTEKLHVCVLPRSNCPAGIRAEYP